MAEAFGPMRLVRSGRRIDIAKRLHQVLLIGTFLPLCWLAMMAVHELGHVVGPLPRVESRTSRPSPTDDFPNRRVAQSLSAAGRLGWANRWRPPANGCFC